ncbi:putative non-specific serine/threonine protein kinase [Helianthus annuus]|nr:putative non-specific serine/threonine protein kinase [Helianthus annuus]
MMAAWIICYCFAFFLIFNRYSTTAQKHVYNSTTTQLEPRTSYPTANLSTTWNNTVTDLSVYYSGDIKILPILFRDTAIFEASFACGFYCNGACTSYLFAVFIIPTTELDGSMNISPPQVVWSANRDYPVSHGAILNFTATGDLVLRDVDGSTVWTTNTTGKSVVGMNLTDAGNLVLFDVNGFVVWQSFDYPTDTLVPGQRLFEGQQLIPSISSTNWTAQKDLYSLRVTEQGLFVCAGSNPSQVYYETIIFNYYLNKERRYC